MFEKIKKWYTQGLWTAEMVKQATRKGVITEDEETGILGKEGGQNDND